MGEMLAKRQGIEDKSRFADWMEKFCARKWNIDFSIENTAGELWTFCKDGSIFRNDIVSRKYHVLGRFSFSCTGIYISAYQTGRLSAD